MSVERDDLGYAHRNEFLQHLSAVQRFARVAAMLTSAVKAGHHDRDRLRLAARSGYDAFEIGIMIVRRHMVLEPEHIVSDRIVAHIAEDIKILASHSLHDKSLAVARSKSRAYVLDKEGVFLELLTLGFRLLVVPVDQIIIYLVAQVFGARECDDRHVGCVFVEIEYRLEKRSHSCLRMLLSP